MDFFSYFKGPRAQKFWPYLLLLGLVMAFFWDSIFAHKVLCLRDISFSLLGFPQFASHAMKTDEWLPLWNPFMGYGKPYVADPEMAFFYPGNWFFYLFAPSRGLAVSYCFSVFVAGASLYALARHWKLGVVPALLAAVSLMFSTYLVAMIEFRSLISTMIWGPLELLTVSYLIERWRNSETAGIKKNFWPIVALGVLVALQYLAGYPQVLFYNQLLVGAYLVARCVWLGDMKTAMRVGIACALAGVITAALVTVQFLPSWEFVQYSERSTSVDPGLDMASVHPSHLLTLLFPYLDGRAGYPHEHWGKTLFEFWVGACYVGILPLIFAFFSPFCWKRSARKDEANELHRFLFVFFVAISGFGLLMAAGKYTPLYMFFYNIVPGFNHFRWPSKFLLYLVYGLCILGGLGCQQVFNWKKQGHRPKAAVIMTVFLGTLVALVGFGLLLGGDGPSLFGILPDGQFKSTPEHLSAAVQDWGRATLFLLLGFLIVLGLFSKRLSATVCGSLIVVVAFSNLWWVSREIQPIMDEDIYELTPKTLNAPFQRMQPWQIYSTNANAGQFFYGSRDRSLYQWGKDAAINDILQGFGLFQAHQVGLRLSRHMSLYSEIPDPQLPEPARERLLDIMNIRYVVFGERFDKVFFENGSKEVQVMDRPSALPKAFVVDGWRSAPDFISAARTMLSPSFDPHREVVLEPLDGTPMPSCFHDPSQNGSAGTVRSLDYKWKSVSLKVDAARDSLLVLTDTWFPGWVATVNGKSVPIYLANANFRAVPLVPGLNEVRMEYRPRAFFIGLAITLTAVFVLLALGALQLVRLWLAPKPVEQPPILRKRKR